MFPIITRISGLLKPHHGRHCAPAASSSPLFPVADIRQRPYVPAPKQDTTLETTPQTAFADPAHLEGFKPHHGSTLIVNTVGDHAPVQAQPPSLAQTAVMDAVTAAQDTNPRHWYPDLPAAPSQLGAAHSPEGHTPCRTHAVMPSLAGILREMAMPATEMPMPDSATLPVADPNGEWFRAELADEARDNAMRAFHRRTNQWLQSGTVPAPRADVGLVLDTQILTAVAAPVFLDVRTDRSEASA